MEEENSRPFGALRFYIMVRFEFLMLYKILNGKSHVTCDSCNKILKDFRMFRLFKNK